VEWKLKVYRSALKFLEERIQKSEREHIIEKLKELLDSLEKGVIPYSRLDIKKLKGKWRGFLRMRVGNVRIIFKMNLDEREVLIYSIHYRGQAYQ